jgi:hypothetical protein
MWAVTFAVPTAGENDLIESILNRLEEHGDIFTGCAAPRHFGRKARGELRLHWRMNLLATHHTCPLDFLALAEADDLTFRHDLAGIERHLDKETGRLRDFFLPRTAAHDLEGASDGGA